MGVPCGMAVQQQGVQDTPTLPLLPPALPLPAAPRLLTPAAAGAPLAPGQATPEQRQLVARIRATTCYYEVLGVQRGASEDDIKKGAWCGGC